MKKPRPLNIAKPVRLIFVGGFLGSGKTTALGALAKLLVRRGKRVGVVTNDQSGNLTDTLVVRQMLDKLDVPVEEVVGGCFCCKFDALIDHIDKVLAHDPDILLGEPVGSCTDFVAAVANPVKINYRDGFVFAPLSTMVDPDRVRELLLGESPATFPEDVRYLFGKQLEEADLIVLNKVDQAGQEESSRLAGLLRSRFPSKRVLAVSAREGEGMEAWLELVLTGRPGASSVLGEIDYDRYAHAEAVLGWLNAAVRISGSKPFNPAGMLEKVILRYPGQPAPAQRGHWPPQISHDQPGPLDLGQSDTTERRAVSGWPIDGRHARRDAARQCAGADWGRQSLKASCEGQSPMRRQRWESKRNSLTCSVSARPIPIRLI